MDGEDREYCDHDSLGDHFQAVDDVFLWSLEVLPLNSDLGALRPVGDQVLVVGKGLWD